MVMPIFRVDLKCHGIFLDLVATQTSFQPLYLMIQKLR